MQLHKLYAPQSTKSPHYIVRALSDFILATTYFPGRLPLEYRRRERVSLPCSGWERVGHRRNSHQKPGISLILIRYNGNRHHSSARYDFCGINARTQLLVLFMLYCWCFATLALTGHFKPIHPSGGKMRVCRAS